MLRAVDVTKISQLVYTAHRDERIGDLGYCVQVNGAVSTKTKEAPKFMVQSTQAGIDSSG